MNSTEVRSAAPPSLRQLPGAVVGMLFRSLGVLALLAVPVLTGLGTVDPAAPGERSQPPQASVWKAAYSERYPGCVPSVLWPDEETPVAVLTKSPGGRVDRVELDGRQQAVGGVPSGAQTIGACR